MSNKSDESNRGDKENADASREQWFDDGFHNWIRSSLIAEWCKRHGKEVPKDVQANLEKASTWLGDLTDSEYSRLIH